MHTFLGNTTPAGGHAKCLCRSGSLYIEHLKKHGIMSDLDAGLRRNSTKHTKKNYLHDLVVHYICHSFNRRPEDWRTWVPPT